MLLDVRTLYTLALFICAILGIAQLLVYLGRRRDSWLAAWGCANLLGALGLLLIALRDYIHPLLSIALGNAMVIGGFCLVWIGFRLFAHRPLPVAWSLLLTLSIFLLFALPSPIGTDLGNRLIVSAIFINLVSLGIAETVARIALRERLPIAWFVLTLFLAVAIIHILRAAVIVPRLQVQDHMANDPMHGLLLLVSIVSVTGWNMGLMLMAAERAQRSLQRAAKLDGLTQTLNRRGLREAAEPLLQAVPQQGGKLALLLIDLDDFKGINDRAGHAVGDRVLQLFAQVARQTLRPSDLIGRYGGDEFVALLPGATLDEARRIGEGLRAGFAATSHALGPAVRPTLSIGAAALAEEAPCLDTLLLRADTALYEAKRQGRNRVSTDPPIPPPTSARRDDAGVGGGDRPPSSGGRAADPPAPANRAHGHRRPGP